LDGEREIEIKRENVVTALQLKAGLLPEKLLSVVVESPYLGTRQGNKAEEEKSQPPSVSLSVEGRGEPCLLSVDSPLFKSLRGRPVAEGFVVARNNSTSRGGSRGNDGDGCCRKLYRQRALPPSKEKGKEWDGGEVNTPESATKCDWTLANWKKPFPSKRGKRTGHLVRPTRSLSNTRTRNRVVNEEKSKRRG